jgi:hypothetical protein
MQIEMHFLPEPGPTATPVFIPNVILGDDQAGLIPNIGDSLTGTDGHIRSVKLRNFTFTIQGVLVLIYCVPM